MTTMSHERDYYAGHYSSYYGYYEPHYNYDTIYNPPSNTPYDYPTLSSKSHFKDEPVQFQSQKSYQPRKHTTPRSSLRPGPYDRPPEIILPSSSAKSQVEICKEYAEKFVSHVLYPIRGVKHITYESVRKFGRFDMRDNKMTSMYNCNLDIKEQSIQGLGRLWQIGKGIITVREFTGTTHQNGKQIIKVHIYETNKTVWNKLSYEEARNMVFRDPLWKTDIKDYHLIF